MKWAVVTGACGFLGAYVVRELAARGWHVAGVGSAAPAADLLPHMRRFTVARLPSAQMIPVLRELRPQAVIHAAGRASVAESFARPTVDFENGPPVVCALLEQLRLYSPESHFIFLSSAAVYGDPERLPIHEDDPLLPVSPYGHHKLMCEGLCRGFSDLYGLATTCLRIFSAYGVGLRRQVVWDLCRKLSGPGPALLQGTGAESRDFIHAHDVARAIALVADQPGAGAATYNLATGRETTIGALAQHIARLLGSAQAPQFDGVQPRGVPRSWRANIGRIMGRGFVPAIDLERGLAETALWHTQEMRGPWRRDSA